MITGTLCAADDGADRRAGIYAACSSIGVSFLLGFWWNRRRADEITQCGHVALLHFDLRPDASIKQGMWDPNGGVNTVSVGSTDRRIDRYRLLADHPLYGEAHQAYPKFASEGPVRCTRPRCWCTADDLQSLLAPTAVLYTDRCRFRKPSGAKECVRTSAC